MGPQASWIWEFSKTEVLGVSPGPGGDDVAMISSPVSCHDPDRD